MNDNYKKIFSGFLLVMLDINIGTFDILPDVIGYLLVLSRVRVLYYKTGERSFGIARYFAVWMIFSAAFEIVTGTFRLIHMPAFPSYAIMIFGALGELILVVSIYQGMTAHMTMLNETELSHRFASENKRYVLIQGLTLIVMSFSLNMPKEGSSVYMITLIVVSFAMHIRFLINLNLAKNLFELEPSEMM